MIINKKSKNGITLISMILTVIVLLIIIGAISYSSQSSFQMKKIENLYSDIDTLKDAISVYYVKNKALPVYYSNYTMNGSEDKYQEIRLSNYGNNNYLNIPKNDYDDLTSYYIIDITKLNNITLNNKNNVPEDIDKGDFFSKSSDRDNLMEHIDKGIFIVNASTHVVYYTKGITIDGNTYYTKNEDYSKIPTFSKTDKTNIEDEILDVDDEVEIDKNKIKIIFYANGGVDAPENIVVDRNPQSDIANSLEFFLEGGPHHTGSGVPVKNGMKFLGWSTNAAAGKPEYKYSISDQGGKSYIDYELGNNCKDIKFSDYPGDVIELYAVWEIDESNILYCYYPDSTGGMKPTVTDNRVSRTGVAEAVSNYLCIDIASSGYTVSWNWEQDAEDEQFAQYAGESQTTEITGTRYQTTEPGTIQLKGSFQNLKITVSNTYSDEGGDTSEDKIVSLFLEESNLIKDVNFYKISNSAGNETKDATGSLLLNKWITGRDGKITIPSKPRTYDAMGITDPERTRKFSLKSEDSLYYIKNAILTKADHLNDITDYKSRQNALGSIVQITEENNCLYPCFGARNYSLTNSTGGVRYYHESLQEAFEQAKELKYDTITMLRDTSRYVDEEIDDKFYVAHCNPEFSYDPTYSKICKLESKKEGDENYFLTLDCSNYKMIRQGKIILTEDTNLILKANNSDYGIEFSRLAENNAIELNNLSNLYIRDNVSVISDAGTVISLNDMSKCYVYKGIVKNISNNNPIAISSLSSSSYICLGIECEMYAELEDYNNKLGDDETIVSTEKGLAINTSGNLLWKSGILKTRDTGNKICYNEYNEDGTEKTIFTSKDSTTLQYQKSCLSYDSTENRIQARLGIRDWKCTDLETGTYKTFYTSNLQDANNCINLTNNPLNLPAASRIEWLNPRSNSGEENSATINKSVHICFKELDKYGRADFSYDTSIFDTSQLTIDNVPEINEATPGVAITGLHCETREGIRIKNNSDVGLYACKIGVNSNNPSVYGLYVNNSEVFAYEYEFYTKGASPAIYNQDGYIDLMPGDDDSISSTTDISNKKIYSITNEDGQNAEYIIKNATSSSILKISADIDVNNTKKAILNNGTLLIKDSNIKKNTDEDVYVIENTKELKVYGYSNIEAYKGIKTAGGSGTLEIYDATNIKAKNKAIHIGDFSGSGNLYIYSTLEDDCPIIETINDDSTAVAVNGNSTFVFGTQGNGVSIEKPIIKSQNIGINIANSTIEFYFYDGKVMAKTEPVKNNTTCHAEVGYALCINDVAGYKVARLGPEAPKISAKAGDNSYSSGTWTNKNITVKLTCDKPGAGIVKYEWRAENGNWTTNQLNTKSDKTGEITFKVDRNQNVYFRVIDNNSVYSNPSSIKICLDKTSPTITISTNGATKTIPAGKSVTLGTSVGVDCSISGNKSLKYAWSTSNSREPTSWNNFSNNQNITKTCSTASTYYLWIKVIDNAGNTKSEVSSAFVAESEPEEETTE